MCQDLYPCLYPGKFERRRHTSWQIVLTRAAAALRAGHPHRPSRPTSCPTMPDLTEKLNSIVEQIQQFEQLKQFEAFSKSKGFAVEPKVTAAAGDP